MRVNITTDGMEGKVKAILGAIELEENFSGLSSIWIQSEGQTSEETAYALQTHLRNMEEATDSPDNPRPDNDPDASDTSEFPINYYIEIDDTYYKASDIKSLGRKRSFEDGHNFWAVVINGHNTDYDLGVSSLFLNFATERERDEIFDDIVAKLNRVQNVRFL